MAERERVKLIDLGEDGVAAVISVKDMGYGVSLLNAQNARTTNGFQRHYIYPELAMLLKFQRRLIH